jgi:hypothetical protein
MVQDEVAPPQKSGQLYSIFPHENRLPKSQSVECLIFPMRCRIEVCRPPEDSHGEGLEKRAGEGLTKDGGWKHIPALFLGETFFFKH